MIAAVRPPTSVAGSANAVLALLTQGRIGGCIACHGSSVWWLPDGFTDGASLCVHPRCVPTFYAMDEFEDAPSVGPVAPMGAYAAMGAPVAASESAVPLRRTVEWAYDNPARWVVRMEGVVSTWHTPFGRADRARELYERILGLAERGVSVDHYSRNTAVGLALVDPAGAVLESWGTGAPPDAPRWVGLMRTGQYGGCTACHEPLWPSCWHDRDGRCQSCVKASEPAGDPRPYWPVDPPKPPWSAWPEHMRPDYKAKKSARRR